MKTLLLFTLLFSSHLFASKEVGNGGDAVVCRNNAGDITKVELLDYYEARVMRGIEVNLGDESLSVEEKVDLVLKRLKKRAPLRFAKYTKLFEEFFDETKFISNIHLVDIPDSENVLFGKGCLVEQLAIQHEPTFPQDSRYLINKDLWDLMSKDHQAGLILHEIIYLEALNQEYKPHENSKMVRYFNSFISSDLMLNSSAKSFYETVYLSELYSNEIIQGLEVNLFNNPLVFNNVDVIPELKSIQGIAYYIQGRSILAAEGSKGLFHSNGILKELRLKNSEYFKVGNQKVQFLKGSTTIFYSNGSLSYGELVPSQSLQALNYKLAIRKPLTVFFHENGMLKHLIFKQNDVSGAIKHNGDWHDLCPDIQSDELEFDTEGNYSFGCLLAPTSISFLGQIISLSKLQSTGESVSGEIRGNQMIKYLSFDLELKDGTFININNNKVISATIVNEIKIKDLYFTSRIRFYDCDGCPSTISSAHLAKDSTYIVNGLSLNLKKSAFTEFDLNENIIASDLNGVQNLTLHNYAFTFTGISPDKIELYSNGMIKAATLNEAAKLKCSNGKVANFPSGNKILKFDSDGFLNSEIKECRLN
jgi:hypothetical protein